MKMILVTLIVWSGRQTWTQISSIRQTALILPWRIKGTSSSGRMKQVGLNGGTMGVGGGASIWTQAQRRGTIRN